MLNYRYYQLINCMDKIISFVLTIVAGVLLLDFLGAVMWCFSGQIPPTDFFVGAITKNVVLFVMSIF